MDDAVMETPDSNLFVSDTIKMQPCPKLRSSKIVKYPSNMVTPAELVFPVSFLNQFCLQAWKGLEFVIFS